MQIRSRSVIRISSLTVTGKIQKFVMRDRMIEELGLSVDQTA